MIVKMGVKHPILKDDCSITYFLFKGRFEDCPQIKCNKRLVASSSPAENRSVFRFAWNNKTPIERIFVAFHTGTT